ncbi:hypothetical protein [Paenibacillus sp. SN-8-1]|uniref:hypothetical protein n=1 Tax=Paenibacillus sp. SN-8-1 TaxID=3435409 RepID=UPI003D9A43B9
MQITQGKSYWGYNGNRLVERKVTLIETRSSGAKYVNWVHIKRDLSLGTHRWTEERKFRDWALFEVGEDIEE